MKTLRSYVQGRWHEAGSDFVTLIDPSTEAEIARASSAGIDFGGVLDHARTRGGPALRELGFAERGALLKEMSRALKARRDELLELSRINMGTTTPDGSFDIDGAGGALAWYAGLARTLTDGRVLAENEVVALDRSEAFFVQHVLVPRTGAAVLINAFNFPAWGFAEKAACAILAGMPVIVKPATATALVAERYVEIIIDAAILPEGALQLVCGGTGDLLDRLGAQDVLAFTGSADTARRLRERPNFSLTNTRINIEADSLNAAVLAPGTDGGTFDRFLHDVVHEITQKAGQKCTAVRRILVARSDLERVQDALVERLGDVVTGNPADGSVTMGPLTTRAQLDDAIAGIAELGVRRVAGSGRRADGRGSPRGVGYFLEPTLLRAEDARSASVVHEREVFGPVSTLMPHDGTPDDAAGIVALGGGMLVTSVHGDDADWVRAFALAASPHAGRIYVGADGASGSGAVFPQAQHGGPGRAGGGAELGGFAGLRLYTQRVAVQGPRGMLEAISGSA